VNGWIDFRELKAKLKFPVVLEHYGIELTRKGEQAVGYCPLPTHGSNRKSKTFSANLERGVWQCFGCKAKGNVLDFAVIMEDLSPADAKDVRRTAIILRDALGLAVGEQSADAAKAPAGHGSTRAKPARRRDAQVANTPATRVNEPLDFELKDLDPSHPYLKGRGLSTRTIAQFGLGFCSRGMLKDRIAIPLHDSQGRLIGYAGRLVDDTKVSDENAKYKLPSSRERDGVLHEFRKSFFLYHGHTITKPVDHLIVVEGFASVWWLWEHGYADTVAIMGSSVSQEQVLLLTKSVTPHGEFWIMTDGDEAGDRCAGELLKALAPHRLVRWIALPPGTQPTDFGSIELQQRFPEFTCR